MRERTILRRPGPDAGPPDAPIADPDRWREVGQGEMVVGDDPRQVLTATLGSCVAVILHSTGARIGGMTHIFRCVDPGPAGGAAVVAEIERLVNALMRRGLPRSALEAKVVGGAQTLGRGRDVGGQIARVALEFLRVERMTLSDSDVGGTRARRITFRPTTGGLLVAYPGAEIPAGTPPAWHRRSGDTELF